MRFLAAGFSSGGEIDLCLTNFRVSAIADAFRKCIGHLAFVAIVGWWKSLYVLNKFNDLGIVNLTISFQLVLETADYDSNIALKVFDYPFDVEVGDCLFPSSAGDVGQRFSRIHKSILGKASCAEGS